MEFTQAEAKKKAADGQWLRTREERIKDISMPKGTRGQVIGADALRAVGRTPAPDIWVVHVRFPSEGVLMLNIGKDLYLEAFEEIASEGQSSLAPLRFSVKQAP